MNDRKVSGDIGYPRKEARLWAWICCGCVMLPAIMFPGNLGPIAIVIGFIFFGIPALIVGFILGKIFGSPRLANRLILAALGLSMMAYMFYYVRAY